MGYYDGNDLNYYYYMASQFSTSDRWFSPVMSRTQPNRHYLMSATSQGYVYPIGTNSKDQALLTAPTIFQKLQAAGISWKIYVNPRNTSVRLQPDGTVSAELQLHSGLSVGTHHSDQLSQQAGSNLAIFHGCSERNTAPGRHD